ncbi:MAG TPA: hypothetical protein VIL85_18310 [Thermomicrobiales bacterium]|jgi:hypothetical protein
MSTPTHDDPLAALAARRAKQAILDADHRGARLQAARRHEDELFAGADRLVLNIGGFLRRLRKSEGELDRPAQLHRSERNASSAHDERDAA